MSARPTRGVVTALACLLALLSVSVALGGPRPAVQKPLARARPPSRSESVPAKPPRAFLIYLIDGADPIVVKQYVEEDGQVRFEKYGGWVGIPKYEVLKIVPDEPDATVSLPPPPDPGPTHVPPPRDAGPLYVTMKGGAAVKATAVAPEGERVRITLPDGSFTVPRSDLVGVVRVPSGADTPEAWLSIVATETAEDGAASAVPAPSGSAPPAPTAPHAGASAMGPRSNRPHLLRLANGQLLRVDGFWIEDGEVRFQRLGGLVGVALSEVVRFIPQEFAPVHGRTPVRFARQLGPDLLEVWVRSGVQRVRLGGIEPVEGTRTAESPWSHLDRGLVIYLEFDRQRYTPAGEWLAYVFLPSGRMLNAELIRLGLARPRADGRNLRYLDLFHEIAEITTPDALAPAAPPPRSN